MKTIGREWEFGSAPRHDEKKKKKPSAKQETAQPTAARFKKSLLKLHVNVYKFNMYNMQYHIFLANRLLVLKELETIDIHVLFFYNVATRTKSNVQLIEPNLVKWID